MRLPNKAESGASVLINIPTGEILAMASYPDFNPNNREGATLNDFRNRAISDTFEPGSTVKPLVLMTALQQGLVQPDSVIDTHPYTLDGHRIRDVGYYPELTMTGILQKSSDTGVSRLSGDAHPASYRYLPELWLWHQYRAGFNGRKLRVTAAA